MNARIEKLKEAQAKTLAQAIEQEKMRETVTRELNLDESAWGVAFPHAHSCDCKIGLQAETLPDAILIAEKMDPVTLARVKGTFLSFVPLERAKPKDNDVCETIAPYIYIIDGLRQYAEERTLRFYVRAAEYIVQVDVSVQSDPDTRRYYSFSWDKYGNPSKDRNEIINKSGYFPHEARYWSTPDQPSRFVLWSY